MIYFSIFLFGTILGSFLNVVIYRVPREESIVFPSSYCPFFRRPVRWSDNIPLLGYGLLRGRCRFCRKRIPFRYPLVEFLNGIGYVYLTFRFGLTGSCLVYSLFYSALLVITFIDLSHQIVPDRITLPGMAIGLVVSSTLLQTGFLNAVIGLFLGGGLFYLVALLSKGGMGGGDIKLIAMIGAFAGWKAVLLTIFISAFTGSLLGIGLMLFMGKTRKYPVPFGPFLALGAMVSILWGNPILTWYTHLGM